MNTFPCRKCKTHLEIRKYRFFDTEEVRRIHFVVDIPCPNCGERKPLRRFINTFFGKIILFSLLKLMPVVIFILVTILYLLFGMILLSLTGGSYLAVFISILVYIVSLYYAFEFVTKMIRKIFPNVLGVNIFMGTVNDIDTVKWEDTKEFYQRYW